MAGGIFDQQDKKEIKKVPGTENISDSARKYQKKQSALKAAQNNSVADEDPKQREDYKSVHVQQKDQAAERAEKKPTGKSIDEIASDAAGSFNNAQMGSGSKNVEKELEEAEEFSKEDLELAEKLIFDGHAEKDFTMENFLDNEFTICTMTAEDVNMIDVVLYEKLKSVEDDKGKPDISQASIDHFRNNAFIALSYRGMNKVELCAKEPLSQLNSIKNAIRQYNDYLSAGQMKELEELKPALFKAINVRVLAVSRLSINLIDFLSQQRYEFETRMGEIMNQKKVLPKS